MVTETKAFLSTLNSGHHFIPFSEPRRKDGCFVSISCKQLFLKNYSGKDFQVFLSFCFVMMREGRDDILLVSQDPTRCLE